MLKWYCCTTIVPFSSCWLSEISLKSSAYVRLPTAEPLCILCLSACATAASSSCLHFRLVQADVSDSRLNAWDPKLVVMINVSLFPLSFSKNLGNWKTNSQRWLKLVISSCSTWSYLILQHTTQLSCGIGVLALMERHGYYKQFRISRCVS